MHADGYIDCMLNEKTDVILKSISYMNRQKWLIKGNEKNRKLYSRHGNGYVLCHCESETNKAIVYDKATDENSNLTFISDTRGENLYKIQLTNNKLYLTTSNNSVIWASEDVSNPSNQLWKLTQQPENLHNGCDTLQVLNAQTINELVLKNRKFVVRYYKLFRTIKGVELSTIGNSEGVSNLERTINNLKNKGVDLDSSDYLQYVNSIVTKEEFAYHSNNLTLPEKERLNKKVDIVSVYQNAGNKIEYFSEKHAKLDAFCALLSAKSIGQPENTAIYFAVDYVPRPEDLDIIEKYFEIIKSKIGTHYKIGIYGTGEVCYRIKQERKYAEFSWLGQAPGRNNYGGYSDISKYNIKQLENTNYNNVQFDDDIAVDIEGGYGQWQ